MNNFNVKWIYTLRLGFFCAIIIFAIWRSYRVNHNIRYTVATTTRQISTPRNNAAIEYKFSVDGRIYTSVGADIKKYNIQYPNGRYYVKFPFKSPGANEIQWDLPVPDSIINVPKDGWKELPR
jgi:hypothetical protein